MTQPQISNGYGLLDSGDGVKIEQLGATILSRPSSWCIWKRDGSITPDITYNPKNEGWSKEIAPWPVEFPELGVHMEARLQRNGQIGVFPEHATYLPAIASMLREKPGAAVLNLFAFTGLASMVALKNGAAVTHVDILKPALDWTARNADLNEVNRSQLRLIPDEALAFLNREVRRASKYDLIILDPPSFSRISKGKDWELEGVLRDLLSSCLNVLSPNGSIYFTCHHGELAGIIIENLIREVDEDRAPRSLNSHQLKLSESSRKREIPAGFLTIYQR